MAEKYYSIITNRGKVLEAASSANGTPVIIKDFVVGDGNGMAVTPDPARITLIHEVFRAAISKLEVSPDQANQWIAHLVIPANVGGFTVREVGLLTDAGELYAVANCAAIEKPQSGVSVSLQFRLAVSETANIELKVATGDGLFLRQDANLSDVNDKAKSRESLVVYSKQEVDAADKKLLDAAQKAQDAAKAADDNANTRLLKSGGTMTGVLVITDSNGMRLKQPKRSFFFRFDGSNLYLLKTKDGDPDGTWDDARPFAVDATTGIVTLGSDTVVNGPLHIGDAGSWIANDGNIWGKRWNPAGAWLWDTVVQQLGVRDQNINNVNNRANDAWNKANDAQVNRVQSVRLSGVTWTDNVGNSQLDYGGGGQILSGVWSTANYAPQMRLAVRQIQVLVNGGWYAIGGL